MQCQDGQNRRGEQEQGCQAGGPAASAEHGGVWCCTEVRLPTA